mmetsp:Transcript_44798/g.103625  ORF Transcript_44798/g.103625 Transcript_44798/m.103625 type:complete len:214 (-) Transcript_44798:108-749(-)
MAKVRSCVLVVLMAIAAFEAFSSHTAYVSPTRAPAPKALRSSTSQSATAKLDRVSTAEATEAQQDLGALLRAAVSIVAAMVVVFMPMAEAQAARSGGRIGGSAPRMRRAPPRAPPRSVKERVVERNTTIIQRGGMGGGYYAPAPSLGDMVVGAAVQGATFGAVSGAMRNSMGPTGPTATDRALEGQLRQDERQLDAQANEIADLKRQLAELKK